MTFSCHQENNSLKNQSRVFNSYLKKNFNIQMPDEKHFYLFAPQKGCGGCRYVALKTFFDSYKSNSHLTLIYDPFGPLPDSIMYLADTNRNLLIDYTGGMERLNLTVGSASLIISEHQTIREIRTIDITINSKELDKLWKSVR